MSLLITEVIIGRLGKKKNGIWNSIMIRYPLQVGVLRGIHGDTKSWKLVTCLQGSLYFVLVDNRPTSDTYIMWESLILDDKTRKQVLIPPGVGNGHLVMSDSCVFHYKWSYEGDYPDVEEQFTIKWDDPMIGVDWPVDNPILSKRDK